MTLNIFDQVIAQYGERDTKIFLVTVPESIRWSQNPYGSHTRIHTVGSTRIHTVGLDQNPYGRGLFKLSNDYIDTTFEELSRHGNDSKFSDEYCLK